VKDAAGPVHVSHDVFSYWISDQQGVLLTARAVNVKVTVIEMRTVVLVFDVSCGIRPSNQFLVADKVVAVMCQRMITVTSQRLPDQP